MIELITPIKLTPLYAVAEKGGAHLADFEGWRVAASYSNIKEELDAARHGVVLADQSPNGKLYIEGHEAEAVVQSALGISNLPVGRGSPINGGSIYRLRQDLYFADTRSGVERQVLKDLRAAARESGKFVSITDVTHGLAEIRIIGSASRDLLSKLCGLDFAPARFSDHAAQQSSVAKIKQLILRRDIAELPAFSLIGAASLGAYLWETLMRAGQEWSIRPIGLAALTKLETA